MNLVASYFGAGVIMLSATGGGTIQIISIVAGAAIVILAGLFTIRAKNAEWWQQSYEGVKAAYNEEKDRAEKLTKENAALLSENASLKALPNYDLVVGMLRKTQQESAEHSEATVKAIENLTDVIIARLPEVTP